MSVDMHKPQLFPSLFVTLSGCSLSLLPGAEQVVSKPELSEVELWLQRGGWRLSDHQRSWMAPKFQNQNFLASSPDVQLVFGGRVALTAITAMTAVLTIPAKNSRLKNVGMEVLVGLRGGEA